MAGQQGRMDGEVHAEITWTDVAKEKKTVVVGWCPAKGDEKRKGCAHLLDLCVESAAEKQLKEEKQWWRETETTRKKETSEKSQTGLLKVIFLFLFFLFLSPDKFSGPTAYPLWILMHNRAESWTSVCRRWYYYSSSSVIPSTFNMDQVKI